jgi:hypothetical protein
LLCHTSQIATVIKKYNVVHTGAKTQSGGLNDALVNDEYQGSLNLKVAIPPTIEAEYVSRPKIKKDKILFFITLVMYINLWKIIKLFGLLVLVVELGER